MNELLSEWIEKAEGDYATAQRELLELCLPLDASLDLQRDLLIQLDHYAVRYRYPGASAERKEAKEAFRAAKQIRAVMRQKLGLHDRD